MMKWRYIAGGMALLLVGSYLDNLRGLLLPLISNDLNLGYARSSWLFALGNLAAIAGTWVLVPILRRTSEKALALGIAALAAGSTFGTFWVEDFFGFLVFAFMVGACISMGGAISNLLVIYGTPLEKRPRFFCGLHFMYGFGSLLSPVLGAIWIAKGQSWQGIIATISAAYVGLFIGYLTLRPKSLELDNNPRTAHAFPWMSWTTLLPAAVFILYVPTEVLMSSWMVTYLTQVEGLTVIEAAPYLSGFFIVMVSTRLLCFFKLNPKWEPFVVKITTALALVSFLMGHLGWHSGFILAGLLGPFFPVALGRTTQTHAIPQELTILILTVAQLSLGLSQLGIGQLAKHFGVQIAFALPLALGPLGLVLFHAFEKKRDKTAAIPTP